MLTTLLLVIGGILLFAIGYHLGYQIGTTEHIRKRINRDRRNRSRQSP